LGFDIWKFSELRISIVF